MKKLWIGILILGLLVRLIIAWLPVTTLITRTLPDDAFIYFVIARHLAHGLGATFDGLTPTNGFHPLWAWVIAPLFGWLPAGDWPIHIALTVEAMCDVAAGALAAWTVARVMNRPLVSDQPGQASPALITFALYLFNPRAIQESVNGLETGLALLMLAGCVAAWVTLWEAPTSKRAVLFGVLAGLCVLARSDLGLIVGLLALALLVQKNWRAVLIAGGVALAVVAPWFIWSQLQVGTLVQSSSVAIPSLVAYRIQTSSDFGRLWSELLFPIINYSIRDLLIYPGAAIIAWIVGVVFVRLSKPAPASPAVTATLPLGLPLAGAVLIVLVHTFVRWYPRGWYFAPLAWSGALVGGPMLAAGLSTPLGRRVGLWIVIGLGLILVAQSIKMINEPEYNWQADMRAGADWLKQNTQDTDTIGAFNAGIYAYYSERRVLSLDGLVDWKAIEARQQKRLLDYFVARGGTLMIDHRAYVLNSFGPFFGSHTLELIVELPVNDPTYGPIVVYQIR